jgi:hypothetical protein
MPRIQPFSVIIGILLGMFLVPRVLSMFGI